MPYEWDKLKQELDDDQLRAVESTSRFVRVIAGAGSGKTRILTNRFAYILMRLHVPASRVLCVTFTNKAADEMRQRILDRTGNMGANVLTLNSLGNHILKDEINRIGWNRDYGILGSDEDTLPVIHEIFVNNQWLKQSGDEEERTRRPDYDVAVEMISTRKNECVKDAENHESYLGFLTEEGQQDLSQRIEKAKEEGSVADFIFYSYLKLQYERKLTDFTDQACMPLLMFDKYPEMLETWSRKYDHILVDEFQDVSYLNYLLCEKLCGENSSLFVVGDPDQTIYTWRDASPDLLINFPRTHENTESIAITRNYRNPCNIVENAKRLISCNESEEERVMIPVNNDDSIRIQFYHALTVEEEAESIANKIEELVQAGFDRKTIAILYRTHKSAIAIKQVLKAREIPFFESTNDIPLFERRAAKTALAVMRLVISGSDADYDQAINYLKEQSGKPLTPMFDDLEEGESEYNWLKRKINSEGNDPEYAIAKNFVRSVEDARIMNAGGHGNEEDTYTVGDILNAVLLGAGIRKYADELPSSELNETIELLAADVDAEISKNGPQMTLQQYLDHAAPEHQEDDEAQSKVQLMTIHASKGLEFDHVFVIQMTENTMPLAFIDSKGQLAEERRLAYVAFTRAKKGLYLSDYEKESEEGEGEGEGEEKAKPIYTSRFIIEDVGLNNVVPTSENRMTDEFLAAAKELIRKKNGFIYFRGLKLRNDGFTIDTRVEHILFGQGTILDARKGAFIIQFDNFSHPLAIRDFDKLKLIQVENEEQEPIPVDLEALFKDNPDDTPKRKRFRRVLELINKAARSEDHRKTTVLPLECGSGKSSAISLRICQTIEAYKNGSRTGILIMSDNRKQLRRYLEATDPMVRSYIEQNRSMITILDKDDTSQEKKTMRLTPVLIITIQRYVQRYTQANFDELLKFGDGCRRDLILIDEEVPEYDIVCITEKELNDIATAFAAGLSDQANQDDKAFCIEEWDRYRTYLKQTLRDLEEELKSNGHNSGYKYYMPKHEETCPWCDTERNKRFWSLVEQYRNNLEWRSDIHREDYKNLHAIHDMFFYAETLYRFSSEAEGRGQYASSLNILICNDTHFESYSDTLPKIVILDGTGAISPVYDNRQLFEIDKEPCEEFNRDLSNATINIYNAATGRTTLKMKGLNTIVGKVDELISQQSSESEMAVFTYKDEMIMDRVKSTINKEDRKIQFGHFGGIRGLNDYNNCDSIYQLGLFKKPDHVYFFTALVNDYRPDGMLAGVLERAVDNADTTSFISVATKDRKGETYRCLCRSLLTDIIQNFFRGIVRNDTNEPYTYTLILSYKEYELLIKFIEDWFGKRHGATVNRKGSLTGTQAPTKYDLFFEWYRDLPVDTEYTTKEIMEVMGIPLTQSLPPYSSKNKAMTEVLTKDRVKKGVYKKKPE